MSSTPPNTPKANSASLPENHYSASDVATILRQHSWQTADFSREQSAWCEQAAAILGPRSPNHDALESLLTLIFHYDAQEILAQVDAHITLSRYSARDALRELANQLLDPAPLTPDRFNAMIDAMKTNLDVRGRELFHTIRLALAGRSGEGDLDRVILLLDEASAANFSTSVKSSRTRIIEFCSAID